MSEETGASESAQLTFHIKSSSDAKHTVTVPETMTVLELKEKLADSQYADVPAGRQRLIYSGRVLRDHDALSVYKIKEGNTVHMVKSAVSTQRQNQSSTGSASSNAPPSGVPQNLATGTGNDPLAGLTGARYAGFAQMPGAGMFGPDGGMGPPPDADRMIEMLDNPMFQSQMTEAMNNPQVIQMMQNSPMIRDNPMMRNMLNNPEIRRMMMDPNFLRQSMRMMGSGGPGGQAAMLAPGVTDTTPTDSSAAAANPSAGAVNPQSTPPNPFAYMGQPGAGGAGSNPFAALFGGMNPPSTNPTIPAANTASADQASQFADFAGLSGGNPQQQSPFGGFANQMMQNPDAMRAAMEMAFGGGNNPFGAQQGAGAGANAANPFAMFGSGGMGGLGAAPAAPADTRPPEEQYAEQLRQLNDMGFYEFDRNIRALRRSGGSVQGAVEALLSE